MGLSAKVFVVLLLLLVATEEQGGSVQVALARDCESDSHKFHGACFSDTNCANVCQTEGFTAGKCVGVQRHCHCTKDC
ncbi:Defensin Tk-AMP-D1.1 [Triticum urartu]|nr:defensin Tk-AMP-D1.1 [Triticum dicoccoides]XP_044337656.1 defensin Tk-AMP-D1.1 [Triticum aestivum]XP_048568504.1 defensin Tk-AMP-D1.1 [Triticum urartu]EMS52277.1 Defensin Tk-AMP-D1.1 [Triticum urartu]